MNIDSIVTTSVIITISISFLIIFVSLKKLLKEKRNNINDGRDPDDKELDFIKKVTSDHPSNILKILKKMDKNVNFIYQYSKPFITNRNEVFVEIHFMINKTYKLITKCYISGKYEMSFLNNTKFSNSLENLPKAFKELNIVKFV
jgi:hypothetical protein